MASAGGGSTSGSGSISFADAIAAIKEDRVTLLCEKEALEKKVKGLQEQLADALKQLTSATSIVEAQNKRVKILEMAVINERDTAARLTDEVGKLAAEVERLQVSMAGRISASSSPQKGKATTTAERTKSNVSSVEEEEYEKDFERDDDDDEEEEEEEESEGGDGVEKGRREGEEGGSGFAGLTTVVQRGRESEETTVEFGDGTILEYADGQITVIEKKRGKEGEKPKPQPADLDSLDALASLVSKSAWQRSGTLKSHFDSITAAVFVEEDRLLTASEDAVIRAWDLAGKKSIGVMDESEFTYRGHEGAIFTLTTSTSGSHFFSGGEDCFVHVWQWDAKRKTPYESYGTATPYELSLLRGHKDAVWSLASHPHSSILVSGSADSTIRVWDIGVEDSSRLSIEVTPIVTSTGMEIPLVSPTPVFLSFEQRNQKRFHCATSSGNFFLFDLEKQAVVYQCQVATEEAQIATGTALECVSTHAILPIAYCGMGDGSIKVIDTTSGKVVQDEAAHHGPVTTIDVHSSGLIFSSAGVDGVVRLWDTTSLSTFQEIEWQSRKGDDALTALAFDHASAKGRLVLGGADGDAAIFTT